MLCSDHGKKFPKKQRKRQELRYIGKGAHRRFRKGDVFMKIRHLTAVLLCAALCFVFCAAPAEGMLGAWQPTEDPAVTPQAAAALDEALSQFVGSTVTPVALLATQVVAGTNYCLLCKITPVVPNPVGHWALVYVSKPLEGSAILLTIDDLELGVWG